MLKISIKYLKNCVKFEYNFIKKIQPFSTTQQTPAYFCRIQNITRKFNQPLNSQKKKLATYKMVEDKDTGIAAKIPKLADAKVIGTHDGVFHCDEILACYMLQALPEYENATILRTRDQKKLDECDIVVDVGSEFNVRRLIHTSNH